ncbi:MAG: MBL fold metallo-hydrolase [Anaerorhabdus sp.]
MEVKMLSVGLYQVNCYILKQNKEVLIIDPGAQEEKIIKEIRKDEKVLGVILTHGHFDHIGAVDKVCDEFKCDVYVNPKDYPLIQDKSINSLGDQSGSIKRKPVALTMGELSIGDFKLFCQSAPGHSKGSTIIQIENILFTGDVVFKSSIGRVDLWGGNEMEMLNTISEFKKFNDDLLIYPGHGDISDVKTEKKFNPYF